MKKLLLAAAIVGSVSILVSCHHHRYHTTTIRMTNGDEYLKIKFAGRVMFSDDSTSIKSISPGGFLSYVKNDKELYAETDPQGHLSLTLFDNGKKLALDNQGKAVLADAVKEMIAREIDYKGEQYGH